jgi:hypothetical protein
VNHNGMNMDVIDGVMCNTLDQFHSNLKKKKLVDSTGYEWSWKAEKGIHKGKNKIKYLKRHNTTHNTI